MQLLLQQNKFTILIFILFISISIFSQQEKFQNVYTSLDKITLGTDIFEDTDGYFICGNSRVLGNNSKFIMKIDNSGNKIWLKKFAANKGNIYLNHFSSPWNRTSDKGFLLIDSEFKDYSNGDYYQIKLSKLDSLGNVLFEKTYADSDYGYYYDIYGNIALETDDKGILICGTKSSTALIIKTDSLGNEQWRKEFYNLGIIEDKGFLLKKYNDYSYLIAGKNNLIMIDSYGNKKWEKNFELINAVEILNDQNIYVGTKEGVLYKLYSSGNVIWEKSFESSINSIAVNDNSDLIVSYQKNLIHLNENGETLWNKLFKGNVYSIKTLSDEGFILTGNLDNFLWVVKTHYNGFNNFLTLIFPEGILIVDELYKIKWLSENSSLIDLFYSTNNGKDWKNIINAFPADSQLYEWEAPYEVSNNCLLKIQDHNNPSLYDITDSTFTIAPYNDYDFIAANQVKMWISNSGDGSYNPLTGGQGFYWPKFVNKWTKGAVFEDGLVWGGKVNGEIRVGGSTYRHGLQPGNILEKGKPANPNNFEFQTWKIKKDWENLPEGEEKQKLEFNYNNWPYYLNAPWVDENGDGVFTKGIDHPQYIGDETLFNVMNDLNPDISSFLYGSPPTGLEIQCLTFAFDKPELEDVVFKKYKLINKSDNIIEDMYLSYWTDDDLGDAGDDYVGVDTTFNFGYAWNGTNDDNVYGSAPPVVAHQIIQGPIVPGEPTDSARYNNSWKFGYKNLPVSSFVFYIGGSAVYRDPTLGRYEGSLQVYNYMEGKFWDGSPVINPFSGDTVKIMLSGDPVTGSGWYDGWSVESSPDDRRFLITSGPFNLAPGDTQEICIAIFMARGSSNINSISVAREKAEYYQNFYNNNLIKELKQEVNPPKDFRLEQNFPNPFNSSTTIQYTIPEKSLVNIKLYDILGREVKTLINKEQVPWTYRINFDASGLASGVYIYRIKTGNFIMSKKMMLLK